MLIPGLRLIERQMTSRVSKATLESVSLCNWKRFQLLSLTGADKRVAPLSQFTRVRQEKGIKFVYPGDYKTGLVVMVSMIEPWN